MNESCTKDDREQWKIDIDEILDKRIMNPSIMDDFLSSVETGMVNIPPSLYLVFTLDMQ